MNLGARHNPDAGSAQGQRRRFAASGYGAPVFVAILSAAVLLLAYNHTRGNFHKIRTAVIPQAVQVAGPTGPGGQGLVELNRSATSVGTYPQFLSMTLAPGRGLDVLQITANIPGHGDTTLLFSPKTDTATQLIGDQGPALRNGTSFGAAFLAPWAGKLSGSTADNPGTLHSMWQSHWLAYPSESDGSSRSVQGLLLGRPSDSVKTGLIPDGESVEALFHAGSFGEAWPSSLDIKTHVDLSGQTIELTMMATNVGPVAAPVGLGWRPFFQILSNNRAAATLSVPSASYVATDPNTSLPSGKLLPVAGTPYDLEHQEGLALGTRPFDISYSGLRRGATTDGPVIELRDSSSNYGLRLIPLSDTISAVHVTAPADQPWVSLELSTNQSDPLGRQWTETPGGSGIRILEPGQSLIWRVRLEIFALAR